MTNAEATALLEQIRTLLAVDDDGPEGSRGPRWVLGQVRELVGRSSAPVIGRSELARLIYGEASSGQNWAVWDLLPTREWFRWLRVAAAVLERIGGVRP